jgi:hypothetical protein
MAREQILAGIAVVQGLLHAGHIGVNSLFAFPKVI